MQEWDNHLLSNLSHMVSLVQNLQSDAKKESNTTQ